MVRMKTNAAQQETRKQDAMIIIHELFLMF